MASFLLAVLLAFTVFIPATSAKILASRNEVAYRPVPTAVAPRTRRPDPRTVRSRGAEPEYMSRRKAFALGLTNAPRGSQLDYLHFYDDYKQGIHFTYPRSWIKEGILGPESDLLMTVHSLTKQHTDPLTTFAFTFVRTQEPQDPLAMLESVLRAYGVPTANSSFSSSPESIAAARLQGYVWDLTTDKAEPVRVIILQRGPREFFTIVVRSTNEETHAQNASAVQHILDALVLE